MDFNNYGTIRLPSATTKAVTDILSRVLRCPLRGRLNVVGRNFTQRGSVSFLGGAGCPRDSETLTIYHLAMFICDLRPYSRLDTKYRCPIADSSSVNSYSRLIFSYHLFALPRRYNARNVSFGISLWWPIYLIDSVDKSNFFVFTFDQQSN